MNIVFFSMTSGLVSRGVETFVHALATNLSTEGHNVTVYQGRKTDARYRVVPISGVSVKTTDVEGLPLEKLLRFLYADQYSRAVRHFTKRALDALGEDVPDILIPMNGGWQTRWVRNIGRARGGKIIISGQAGIGYDDWWNLQQDPDLFVALTPRAEAWARKVRPDVRVARIPNGVDLDQFTPKGSIYPLTVEEPRILCVAGLDRYKRIDHLLHAVSELEAGSVVICGQGEQQEEERIDFLGRLLLGPRRYQRLTVPHRQMPQVYRACSLFSLPSRASEAFGISVVEALASNLHVVLPDNEDRQWIAGTSGVYVDVNDPRAYAHALAQALRSPRPSSPRRQAERFTWKKIAADYEKLFQACLEDE